MDDWRTEIDELHEHFERYFLGQVDSLDRVAAVLASDFTIVGADGNRNDRDATMAMLKAGHAHTRSLSITVRDHRLLTETEELVVAGYVESHELAQRTNHRRSTVVFRRVEAAPNGLHWLRVHETWLPDT